MSNSMNHHHGHGEDQICHCKSNAVTQSLDEMDFERGIWSAALYNDLEKLKHFTGQGQQNATDKNGYTALHYASRNGYYQICEHLLLSGADVNAITKSGGVTALMRASMMGHEKVIKLLLLKKADLYVQDFDGNTALHKAAQNGHRAVMDILLKHDHIGKLQLIRNKKEQTANEILK